MQILYLMNTGIQKEACVPRMWMSRPCTYTWQDDPGNVSNIITPFPPDKLKKLYPTHEDYVRKVVEAVMKMIQCGFVLPEDAAVIIMEAMDAAVPE